MTSRRFRGERGATTEMVVLFPAFFLLVFLGIQFALYYHASHVALAAAQEGARTLRVTQDVGAGETRADQFLMKLSRATLPDGKARGSIDPDGTAHMEVRGTAESILPGFKFTVHEQSQGPVETFRGDK
jgi:Flp pilus assembly protein TadG